MHIGIPRELKPHEGRVGLIPAVAAQLVRRGHAVLVEAGAGEPSGYADQDYKDVGVRVVDNADTLFAEAELIVKVKEPVAADLARLRKDHLLFCYLHLAAEPQLTQKLCDIGLTAIAFETVERADGQLPLLAPMSEIAGRLSMQVATYLLHRPQGGKGLLLGGIPAAPRGHVVVVGAGVAGTHAAIAAAATGARVSVFDIRRDRLEAVWRLGPNVTGLHAHPTAVARAVAQADVVIGAVLVTGARAPHVVTEPMVQSMEPGSVVVDISIDQGGCVETSRAMSYDDAIPCIHGVNHYSVSNLPGAVPRSASQALSATLTRYVLALADSTWRDDSALAKGVNIDAGRVVHPALLKS